MIAIIKKIGKIFRDDFQEIMQMMNANRIGLTSQNGIKMMDTFISVKHLSKKNFEVFLNEILFSFHNLRMREVGYLNMFCKLVKNEHFVYSAKDNQILESFFFHLPMQSRDLNASTRRHSADLLCQTINSIVWRKNITDTELGDFVKFLDDIFTAILDRVHPKQKLSLISEFFIMFFGKFVSSFTNLFYKNTDTQKKAYLWEKMTKVFMNV